MASSHSQDGPQRETGEMIRWSNCIGSLEALQGVLASELGVAMPRKVTLERKGAVSGNKKTHSGWRKTLNKAKNGALPAPWLVAF